MRLVPQEWGRRAQVGGPSPACLLGEGARCRWRFFGRRSEENGCHRLTIGALKFPRGAVAAPLVLQAPLKSSDPVRDAINEAGFCSNEILGAVIRFWRYAYVLSA